MIKTIEVEVCPILIRDKTEENAERIGELFGQLDNLSIHSHFCCDEGLVIFVQGNIGNQMEQLVVKLANKTQYFEAIELAHSIDDETAIKLEEKAGGSDYGLWGNLTPIYS